MSPDSLGMLWDPPLMSRTGIPACLLSLQKIADDRRECLSNIGLSLAESASCSEAACGSQPLE